MNVLELPKTIAIFDKKQVMEKLTVTLEINQPYAYQLLQDLQKAKAVKIVTQTTDAEIPEWQQKLVLERVEAAKKNPSLMLKWDDVKDTL